MLCKSSLGPDPVHMHTVMQVDGGYHAHVTERKACWLGDMCHCMCTPWNKMWTCEQCMNINDPHTLLGLLTPLLSHTFGQLYPGPLNLVLLVSESAVALSM